MKKENHSKIWVVTIFAIAMGFLEAAVVIYTRKLFYPGGFEFPLKGLIDPSILSIEWIREFATIVMLITIGMIAGKKLYEKYAYFVYAFAIWDIFYYIFLKLTLNWPHSFLTWDLLFLIPWPWAAPVLAPLICCVLMIFTSIMLINVCDREIKIKIKFYEWLLVKLGIIIVLFTWLYDYGALLLRGGYFSSFLTLTENTQFVAVVNSYVPVSFNWIVFLIGVAVSTAGIISFYVRAKKLMKR